MSNDTPKEPGLLPLKKKKMSDKRTLYLLYSVELVRDNKILWDVRSEEKNDGTQTVCPEELMDKLRSHSS
jgi:hypothetical protein